VKTLASGETLAERYEQTLARIEQLMSAGYTVKVQWECEFEGADDLLTHPIIRHEPMNTRDALYGVELRPCVFTTKSKRVRSLYSTAILCVSTHISPNIPSSPSVTRSFS